MMSLNQNDLQQKLFGGDLSVLPDLTKVIEYKTTGKLDYQWYVSKIQQSLDASFGRGLNRQ